MGLELSVDRKQAQEWFTHHFFPTSGDGAPATKLLQATVARCTDYSTYTTGLKPYNTNTLRNLLRRYENHDFVVTDTSITGLLKSVTQCYWNKSKCKLYHCNPLYLSLGLFTRETAGMLSHEDFNRVSLAFGGTSYEDRGTATERLLRAQLPIVAAAQLAAQSDTKTNMFVLPDVQNTLTAAYIEINADLGNSWPPLAPPTLDQTDG